MEANNFDYDELTDSLFISHKKEGEKVQGSAEIGDLTLDFTNQGKLVNIEFRGISKYLRFQEINPEFLNKLEEADLVVQQHRGAITVFALLKAPNLKKVVPLATIPLKRALTV